MLGDPLLTLEQLAAISARIEAGVARERVFADAGVAAEDWERAQQSWLSLMAKEAAQKRLALYKRYAELLRQHRDAERAKRGAERRELSGPMPVVPVAVLSSLSGAEAAPQLRSDLSSDAGPKPMRWLPSTPRLDETVAPGLTAVSESPLPFRDGLPELKIAPEPRAQAGMPAPDATLLAPLEPAGAGLVQPSLPFQPPDPARAPTTLSGAHDTHPLETTRDVPLPAGKEPLPFRATGTTGQGVALEPRPPGPVTGVSGAESTAAPPLVAEGPTLPFRAAHEPAAWRLTLAQYAALCAELAVFPEAAEAIFRRYGLVAAEERAAVDAAWKERLRADPEAYREWRALYHQHHTRIAAQARGGSSR